jgi:hypothetical protein
MIQEILYFTFPASLLFILWIIFRLKEFKRVYFGLSWIGLIMLLSAVLLLISRQAPETDMTREAGVLLATSPLWLSGLFLLAVFRKRINIYISVIIYIILSIASIYMCFFHLLFTGQAWNI